MYGTTIKNYNETKESKLNKSKRSAVQVNKNNVQRTAKRSSKRVQDTKYMKINPHTNAPAYEETENNRVNESFSIKDLPIASVIITVILTMMMLVMTSGFGGL